MERQAGKGHADELKMQDEEKDNRDKQASELAGDCESSTNTGAASGASAKSSRSTRRQLLRVGLIASPLLITLRGKPAWAQLSSLGSAGIMYGPGAYVTQNDIDKSDSDNITQDDLGRSLGVGDNGSFKVLSDQTRRDQTAATGPNEGSAPSDPSSPKIVER